MGHKGSIAGGTIAVIAVGIDVVYPPEHKELQERIGEQGLVVAEQPPGIEPQARHFPRRNRIIAGLSLGVIVVEAAPRSGRSEEHTSELQSLMRISYAVFCLKKKTKQNDKHNQVRKTGEK